MGARIVDGTAADYLARLEQGLGASTESLDSERQALESAATALDRAVEELDAARERAQDELPAVAVELAIAIAQELVRTELRAGHHDVQAMVRESLTHVRAEHDPCVIHLNPADAERLSEVRFRPGVTIEANEQIGVGSVHLTTPQGLLVRDVRDSLDAIAERLREEIS